MNCKIAATRAQLTSVGIDRDIRRLKVKVLGGFDSGYVRIELSARREFLKVFGKDFPKDEFDIPRRWLRKC